MTSGKIIIADAQSRDVLVRRLNQMDLTKPWEFTFKPYKRNRSLEQNNLYWKWIALICEAKGWGKNVLHRTFRENFLPPAFEEGPDGLVEMRGSTSKLNTAEMSEYMEKVAAFAATEFNVPLPQPGDKT